MNSTARVHYAREQLVDVADYRRVLVDSGLGAFRPVDDALRLQAMLSGANLIVTARRDGPQGELIGFARCMTDGAWNCRDLLRAHRHAAPAGCVLVQADALNGGAVVRAAV